VVPLKHIVSKLRTRVAFKHDKIGPTYLIKSVLRELEEVGEIREVPKMQGYNEFGTAGKLYHITGSLNY